VIDYASSSARAVAHERVDLVSFLRRLDWILLLAVGAVVAYGLWAVAGITRHDVVGNEDYYVVRQSIAAGLGFVGFLVALAIDPDRYRRAQKGIYAVTLILMLLVFPLGDTTRGSKRWIELGGFQLQPSEFGKLLFVLAIAGFLADRARRVQEPKVVLQTLGLGLLPILLVFKQPDLGTALVYSAAVAACLFVAGIRWSHLAVLISAGVLVVASVVWFLPAAGIEVLEPYQTARLTGFTNPDSDPAGTTYNVTQSITAVGSGGLNGRGVEGATQTRLDYLPEHHTDFVFAALAEQRGFFGAPARALPARRLARPARDRGRARRIQRDRRRRDRDRVPVPGLRQRRHDDGNRSGDGYPASVRHRRRLVDGCEPDRDRCPASDPRARPPGPPAPALMAAKLSPMALWGLVKEMRIAAEDTRPLVISGPLAAQLEKELSRGAAPGAVRVDGRPEDAAVLVRVLAGAPTAEDEKVLRAADRANVPVIAVQTGTEIFDIPYVLATEVVMCSPGSGFPVEEIAQTVAARMGESGTGLAARLPVVREPLSEVLIEKFSRQNAIAAVAIFIPGADFPVLTLNQIRLVLRLGSAHGVEVDQERWPEVLATIAAGLGFRTVARTLVGAIPLAGWLVKGTVAYAGTRAVGEAAHRYFHTGAGEKQTR
jgi:rod shape determining protein RodA